MLRLDLTNVNATLQNLNPRVEKQGTERFPAADLHFSCSQAADILAHFSPTLKSFLFDESKTVDLAGGTQLRDTHLVYPLERDEEMTGAIVSIDYGVKDKMEFADAKINKFKITPHDGGAVILGFRVQCRPTDKQIGRLYLLQETACALTITPAELNELQNAA